MTQKEKNIQGRRITDEYWADNEWHYKFKTYSSYDYKRKRKTDLQSLFTDREE